MKYLNLFLYKNWQYVSEIMPLSITFGIYLQDLLEGSNMKNLVLPMAIFIVWLPAYIIISVIETYFAIEYIKSNNTEPEKLKGKIITSFIRKSLESVVVAVLIFILMSISLLSELTKDSDDGDSIGYAYLTILSIYVFFAFGSIILKGLKIGDWFDKIEGPKDEFFNLIGAFFLILKKKFFDRASNSFNNEPPKTDNLEIKENEKGN